jgi:Fe-S-cluster-containing hydrogenase component 2
MQHQGNVNPNLALLKILRLENQGLDIPVICMACDDAPCIKVCPMNARIRLENGTVITNTDVCIGCRACVYICPVGSPAVNPYTGQTMTCDMCAGDQAGPWCVTACRDGALTVVKNDALTRDVARERAGRSRAVYPNNFRMNTP